MAELTIPININLPEDWLEQIMERIKQDDDCVLLLKKGICEGTWADQYSKCPLVEEPERKKGKWIDDGTELGCCCSECGITLDDYFYGALYEVRLGKMPKFCPNCGSFNGGEQDG